MALRRVNIVLSDELIRLLDLEAADSQRSRSSQLRYLLSLRYRDTQQPLHTAGPTGYTDPVSGWYSRSA